MYVAMRKIVVKEGNADKVVEQFSKRELVRKQEGFVDVTVMKQKARGGAEEVVVLIRWESEAAWKKWEQSDAHIAGHKAKRGQPKPDYIIRSEGGRYEVQLVKEAIKS